MAMIGGGAIYLLTHAVIYFFGLFASGGYDLFLAPLAPVMALMAATGLADVVRRTIGDAGLFRGRLRPGFSRGALIALLLLPVLAAGLTARMPEIHPCEAAIDEAIATLKRRHLDDRRILSTHVRFFYHMPRPIPSTNDLLWINCLDLDKVESGTIALWDGQSSEDFNLRRKQFEKTNSSWRKLWVSVDGCAILYQKEIR